MTPVPGYYPVSGYYEPIHPLMSVLLSAVIPNLEELYCRIACLYLASNVLYESIALSMDRAPRLRRLTILGRTDCFWTALKDKSLPKSLEYLKLHLQSICEWMARDILPIMERSHSLKEWETDGGFTCRWRIRLKFGCLPGSHEQNRWIFVFGFERLDSLSAIPNLRCS